MQTVVLEKNAVGGAKTITGGSYETLHPFPSITSNDIL